MELTEETLDKVSKAESFIKRMNKLSRFSNRYKLIPPEEINRLMNEMQDLAGSIDEIKNPKNQDELISSEIKRRISGESAYMEQQLSGKLFDFDSIVNIYAIPREDIELLKPWLGQNKDKCKESIDRLFQSREIENHELPLSDDIPGIRRQSEEFALNYIQRYHKTIGSFLQSLTNVGNFLIEANAVPTTNDRSYFHHLTNTLGISIPAICYSTEDGTLHIDEKELIKIYGHEGMGHAINHLLTKSNNIPDFLKQSSNMTIATGESIAQFYERRLIEDLKNSREIQKKLGIEHIFDEIYQETIDTNQLEEYNRRLFNYSICVLADKELGDFNNPQTLAKKTEIIDSLAIVPRYAVGIIQENRYNFDSEGNLNPNLVGELRYCANPVNRALQEFSKRGIDYSGEGRNLIDSTLLRGFWTPIGFVDNARLVAEENKK